MRHRSEQRRAGGDRAGRAFPVGGGLRKKAGGTSAILVLFIVLSPPLYASEVSVVLSRIDGTDVIGAWKGFDSTAGFHLDGPEGSVHVPLDELMRAELDDSVGPRARGGGDARFMEFYLSDGGRLPGLLLGGEEEAVRVSTALGRDHVIPLDRLAGLRLVGSEGFDKADSLLASAMANRLPGEDVLITRDADGPKVLRGRVSSLDDEKGTFTLGSRTRTFRTNRVYAIVLASGVGGREPLPVEVHLDDGSVFTVRLVAGGATTIDLSTSIGADVTLPVERISRLVGHSPRVVYVSDLEPVDVRVEGRVHAPRSMTRDTGLMGRKLSVGGVSYTKGISCPSRTELEYDLPEPFEQFVAEIGIDDYVGARGSVVFRVLGDGRTLFTSEVLTGRAPAETVRVDVAGVKRLTLVADYGDELDIADHAVWGGARLIRPAE